MINLTINAESEAVKKGLIEFFKAYRDHLADYLNLELKDSGHLADAGIVVEGETITAYQISPNKGYVLGEVTTVDGDVPIAMMKYSDLPVDARFIRSTKEGLTLYIKSEENVPDVKIGLFISMDDAVTNFNSEKVTTAVQAALESKKMQLKQIKKLKKLGKLDEPEVGETFPEPAPEQAAGELVAEPVETKITE